MTLVNEKQRILDRIKAGNDEFHKAMCTPPEEELPKLKFAVRKVSVPHMFPEGAVLSTPREVYGPLLGEQPN